jgi:HK97 family phage portal protein
MRSPLGALGRALSTLVNTSPVPLASSRRAGSLFGGHDGGVDVKALDTMGVNGTLFAIVGGLATATAQVDWHLYDRPADPEAERTRMSHASEIVWGKPNDFFTRQEFVETVQQHLDLVGECWWVVGRLGGLPYELWPVRPDRMAPVKHPTKFISGYVYTSPDGEKIPLKVDEVIFIRMPNPADIYRGMGPVQALLTDLDSARYSAEWNRNFFVNSARPGGVVEIPTSLQDREFNQLVARWNESHRGVSASHRVAFLEHGKYQQVGFNMRDMQFAELRALSGETIREAYRYPKPLLGSVSDVNRATAEAMSVIHANWLIVPRLERIKAALNNDLLPMWGKGTERRMEWDYASPVPADREADDKERASKASAFATLVAAGVEPEDAAVVVGLPPMRQRVVTTAQPEPEGVPG